MIADLEDVSTRNHPLRGGLPTRDGADIGSTPAADLDGTTGAQDRARRSGDGAATPVGMRSPRSMRDDTRDHAETRGNADASCDDTPMTATPLRDGSSKCSTGGSRSRSREHGTADGVDGQRAARRAARGARAALAGDDDPVRTSAVDMGAHDRARRSGPHGLAIVRRPPALEVGGGNCPLVGPE